MRAVGAAGSSTVRTFVLADLCLSRCGKSYSGPLQDRFEAVASVGSTHRFCDDPASITQFLPLAFAA